jgi:hypothetical protein
MRSYFVASAIVLASHLALGFLWTAYFGLWVDCGAILSHGNDLADIPRQALVGSLIIGIFWLAIANGLVAYVKRAD